EQYTVAFYELKKRGMVGVFFVPTRYVQAGGEVFFNLEKGRVNEPPGVELGGHTIDHEDLTKTNLVEARRQLVASKAILEEKLGHPVVSLSYPFGGLNSRIFAEKERAG